MMATFQLAPDEKLIQCPYEISHQITNLKFLVHLDKCRRNYINKMNEKGQAPDIQHCRYNDAHRYPKVEMEFHQAHCKDQHSVVKHIQFHTSQEFKKQVEEKQRQELKRKIEYVCEEDSGSEEEDWDKDSGSGYQAGYDPSQKLENDAILYVPRGLTKSQRKAWRLEHRKKFAEYQESEMKPDGSGVVFDYDHKLPGEKLKKEDAEEGECGSDYSDD